MPHCKQAAKRMRQGERLRLKNRAMTSAMRTSFKRVLDLAKAGQKTEALAALPLATQRIDKCAKRHILHKNNAARKKSRIARAVAAIGK